MSTIGPPKKKRRTKRKSKENGIKKSKRKKSSPDDDRAARIAKLKEEMQQSYDNFNKRFEELGREIGTHHYKVVSLLGVGSQGRVYLVRLQTTGELFAMKVFMKEQIIENAKTTRSVLTEQRFLSGTDHPFITKLYHSFQSAERLFMVMEYCPGGELWTVIKNQPDERLTEDQVRFFASEVLLVLEYVHSKGYIYRDLKPENILLHLDGHIRMADFGLSKQADKPPEMRVTCKKERSLPFFHSKSKHKIDVVQVSVVETDSLVGSVHYLAPEVLAMDGCYDEMADWWSFGVLLYDMFYGVPPFQGRCNEEVIMKIVDGEYHFHESVPISSDLKSLIKGLLKLDPKKRMCAKRGASDIKKHAFFSQTQWSLLRNRTPPINPSIKYPEDTSNFELYDSDEDDVKFDFFSELPENPDAIPEDEQKKFETFQFTRMSFAKSIIGDIRPRKEEKEQKKRKRRRRRVRKPKVPTIPELKKCKSEQLMDYESFADQNDGYFSSLEKEPLDSIFKDIDSWPAVGKISPHLEKVSRDTKGMVIKPNNILSRHSLSMGAVIPIVHADSLFPSIDSMENSNEKLDTAESEISGDNSILEKSYTLENSEDENIDKENESISTKEIIVDEQTSTIDKTNSKEEYNNEIMDNSVSTENNSLSSKSKERRPCPQLPNNQTEESKDEESTSEASISYSGSESALKTSLPHESAFDKKRAKRKIRRKV